MTTTYKVMPGPEHFLPPSASSMGVRLPDPGQAHIHGSIVSEEEAMEQAAREFLAAKVPTVFPGPLVLWAWNEKAAKKAKAVRHLYETIKECVDPKLQQAMLIPMPDYRPKYPKINPEIEINPNHPNLTIWHNKNRCLYVCWRALSSSQSLPQNHTRRDKLLYCSHVCSSRPRRCDAFV